MTAREITFGKAGHDRLVSGVGRGRVLVMGDAEFRRRVRLGR